MCFSNENVKSRNNKDGWMGGIEGRREEGEIHTHTYV